jgi:hypothetical protein
MLKKKRKEKEMIKCKTCKHPIIMKRSKSKGCTRCIIKERDKHPFATLQEIADKFGYSNRQYIQNVLKDAGRKTGSLKHNTVMKGVKGSICPLCGKGKVPRSRICWDCYIQENLLKDKVDG